MAGFPRTNGIMHMRDFAQHWTLILIKLTTKHLYHVSINFLRAYGNNTMTNCIGCRYFMNAPIWNF